MLVSVCGFGSTGSSAVSDYISEFSSAQVLDSIEFDLIYRPDGLFDLYNHIQNSADRTYSMSYAVERFKKMLEYHILDYYSGGDRQRKKDLECIFDKFERKIISVEWYGFQNCFYSRYKSFFQGVFLGHFFKFAERKHCYPITKISICKKGDKLLDCFKELVNDILLFLGADFSKTVVLDQAFSGNNPQACFPFFDCPKAIVVDRDPRDLFIFANEVLKKKKFFQHTMFMPTQSVEEFINYYRLIRQGQPYLQNNPNIMRVSFEDLIYKYEESTLGIRLFCGLDERNHIEQQFDPSLSIANTQLFKRFPKYKNEVAKIEKELSEYLYHFPTSVECNSGFDNKKMFCGKSPLRRKK